MSQYHFDPVGRFVVENFDAAPPFASFLPGIAGPLGIPLWAFYVNRGQALAGFGVGGKDGALMEFRPANVAYQCVPFVGYRTFIKVAGAPAIYEPFSAAARRAVVRRLLIDASEIELEEVDPAQGLRVNVVYFTLPGEPFAGLVRQVTVTNAGATPLDLELLDGLAAVVPFGVHDDHLKRIGRTVEAWMAVYNLASGAPFFRVQASIGDEAEVARIEAGHFFLPFVGGPAAAGPAPRPVVAVDPAVVFGNNTSLAFPDHFAEHALAEIAAARQVTACRTPCAFAGAAASLAPGERLSVYAIFGHVPDVALIEAERPRLAQPAYVEAKRAEARRLTADLSAAVATHTADARFDAYCRQTLLDNILRGGWPAELGGKIYHLYGRRHGDLERDYNAFLLPPEFYSQGNAAYRDVNQNRRCDVLLNPAVRDTEVLALLSLLQPDGYNPLVVLGCRFVVPPERQGPVLALVDRPVALRPLLSEPFTPGQLLRALDDAGLTLSVTPVAFVETVLAQSEQDFAAAHGEGYWIDHWHYNLDLVDAYLAVYPECRDELLFERTVTYWDSPWFVRPRDRKYVLTPEGVRQYDAVALDEGHAALVAARTEWPNRVRAGRGRGDVFRSTVFEKLVGLAAVKFATLDPRGIGLEMEAGKPGWCDALNGLPALFGSATPGTYELLRLVDFLLGALAGKDGAATLPAELVELLQTISQALARYHADSDENRDFRCWDATASARERFRDAVRPGFVGETRALPFGLLASHLAAMRDKLAAGIARAESLGGGLPPTYFTCHASEFEYVCGPSGERMTDARGRPYVRVTRFEQQALPAFLEGPVHALRVRGNVDAARGLYRQVRASGLYDAKLGMYKTNVSLAGCSHEIGRLAAFTPGWLENESVFLHMAYKYLLEVLRSGLQEEFFAEMRAGLVPFLDPAIYGRSTLENSSFIVSSAHPDESLHGRGFVARLTGACAEFLSIWSLMMAGPQPFFLKDGQLCLRFQPSLPPWLFRSDGTLSFTFLGQCEVTYRRGAGDAKGVKVARALLHLAEGHQEIVSGDVIPAPYAALVRSGFVRRIELDLV